MDEPSRLVRISSARRARNVSLAGRIVLLTVVVIIAVLLVHQVRTPSPAVSPSEAPLPPASPAAHDRGGLPSPPPPSPTAVAFVERSSDWIVLSAPSPTPTMRAIAPPARRRRPTPTPPVSQCVVVRWTAHQSLAAWGNVLVDIHAINRCGRKLEPHEIGIWIAGYRDSAVVQTASGTAFNVVYPGRSTNFAIALPGSIDWYERITVEVMD